MFTIYGGKTEFNQWELGQRVTNPKLTVGNKVRFWNQSGETHPMIAYMHEGVVVADVPNDLLQHCSPILVELCGDPECLTRFIVNAQDKPDGYVFIDNTHCESAPSSGGGAFIVNVIENDGTVSADKTFDEISAAIESGQSVICRIDAGHVVTYYNLHSYMAGQVVMFAAMQLVSSDPRTRPLDTLMYDAVGCQSNNVWAKILASGKLIVD